MVDENKLDLLKSLGSNAESADMEPSFSPRYSMLKYIIGIAVLVVALVLGWSFFGKDNPRVVEKVVAEKVVVTQQDTAPQTQPAPSTGGITASGYVVARRKATVSAEITGTVKEVLIEEGMEVKAGQIVAKLDDRVAKAERDLAKSQFEEAKANIRSLKAQLEEANRVTSRRQKLVESGTVSEALLTEAQSRSEVLTAQLEQAKNAANAALHELERRESLLQKHFLRSPFDGMVIDKNAQVGEIISPTSAGGGFTRTGICTIVDMKSLEVEVDVNEANIARIKPEQNATAILDAYPDWKIPAKVIAIIPTANRDKATIRVRVGFSERDSRILPEMAARVIFLENSRQ